MLVFEIFPTPSLFPTDYNKRKCGSEVYGLLGDLEAT